MSGDPAVDALLSPLKRGTKDYLMKTIVPSLVQGLIQMAIQRPDDPHLWLSEFLLTKSPDADDLVIRRKSEEAAAQEEKPRRRARPRAEPETAVEEAKVEKVAEKPAAKLASTAAASAKSSAPAAVVTPAPGKSESKANGEGGGKREERKVDAESKAMDTPSPTKGKHTKLGLKVEGTYWAIEVVPPGSDGRAAFEAYDIRNHQQMELKLTKAESDSLDPAIFNPATPHTHPAMKKLEQQLSVQGGGKQPKLVFRQAAASKR